MDTTLTVRVPVRFRESRRRAALDFTHGAAQPDALALERARARLAEGEDHRAELGEDCGFCSLPFHPDCAACAGRAA